MSKIVKITIEKIDNVKEINKESLSDISFKSLLARASRFKRFEFLDELKNRLDDNITKEAKELNEIIRAEKDIADTEIIEVDFNGYTIAIDIVIDLILDVSK